MRRWKLRNGQLTLESDQMFWGLFSIFFLLQNSPGFSFKGINHLKIKIAIIYSPSCSFSIQWPFLMTKFQNLPLKSLQRNSYMAQIWHHDVWLRDTRETMTFDVIDVIWCYMTSEQWTIRWTLHNLSILCVCLCCVFCLYRVNQCRQLTVRQQRIVRVHQGFIPHRPAAMPNEDDVMKKTSSRLTT